MMSVWQKAWFSLVLLMAIGAVSGNSFAKDEEGLVVNGVVAVMNQVLKLTTAQVKEITPAVREYVQQVQMLKADGISGAARQEKIRFLRDEMDADLAHYLSEEQMSLWKKQMAEAQEDGNMVAVHNGSSQGGDRRNPSVSVASAQKDDGVLESGDSNETKTSGVW